VNRFILLLASAPIRSGRPFNVRREGVVTTSHEDHILIVDDDQELRTLLCDYLQKNGYRVSAVADGRGMWNALGSGQVDLVILDVMLPGEDGFVLCRNLRARGAWPVIMLTAKGEDTDRIVGLELGADDYLPKPFNPRELLARIKVVLRRHRAVPTNLQPKRARSLRFAGWTLDLSARNLVSPQQIVVELSGAEFRLLRIFLTHPNRVLSRDQLMDLTVGRDADPFDRSLDVQVSRLRQRLGDDAREPAIIKTVRAEGYLLAANVEEQ